MAPRSTVRKVKDRGGDWRGLDATYPGVEEIRGEGKIRSRRISPIGWYVTPWGNMTPALTFKSISIWPLSVERTSLDALFRTIILHHCRIALRSLRLVMKDVLCADINGTSGEPITAQFVRG